MNLKYDCPTWDTEISQLFDGYLIGLLIFRESCKTDWPQSLSGLMGVLAISTGRWYRPDPGRGRSHGSWTLGSRNDQTQVKH